MEDQPHTPTVVTWLKDQEFWKGIAIQTVGSLLAATVVALIAILTGVGFTGAIRYFVLAGLLLLAIFAIGAFGAGMLFISIETKLGPHTLLSRNLRTLSTLLTSIGIAAVEIVCATKVLPLLAVWTGYHR